MITNEYDKEYLVYFFSIMLSYTFLNGECPISYMAKKIVDNNYVAGDNCTHPEMRLFFCGSYHTILFRFPNDSVYGQCRVGNM